MARSRWQVAEPAASVTVLALALVAAVRGEGDAQAVLVETHGAHGGAERESGGAVETGQLAAVEA